jgi:hypothetical protein
VHLVRHPERTAARLRRGATAVLLGALIAVGCGGSDGGGSGSGSASLDAPVRLANCTDWNEGSVEERLGTIRQIGNFVGGPVPGTGGRGITLEEDEAYDLFERFCSEGFAERFTLYRIYVRAVAVSGRER